MLAVRGVAIHVLWSSQERSDIDEEVKDKALELIGTEEDTNTA
jgi:hypothetical protein